MAPKTDVIAELRSRIAKLEAQTQWQPISTAPKDGTVFLGYKLGKLCISAHHAAQFEKMTALSLSW